MAKSDKALAKQVVVKLGDEKHTVEKLPLGKYVKLISALQGLPAGVVKDLQSIDTDNEEESVQALIGLVAGSWDSVLDILALGSGVDKDRIENDPEIGLDGGIELFLAIYEVNNLSAVFSKVKNVFSRPKD